MSEALNDAITSSSRSRGTSGRAPSGRNVSASEIPDETRMGPPTLKVKDLDKMLSFYEGTFGLLVNSKRAERSSGLEVFELGVKEGSPGPLLILKHDSNAEQPPRNFAGLFHFAILVPDRRSLARAFLALHRKKDVHFEGFADHLVSESLYLHDPEGNGIEIYRDRPSSDWTHDNDGHVVMDTLPLDLAGILSELPAEERASNLEEGVVGAFPNGARIGHMHLRVTNLERSVEFYKVLGFHTSADWSTFGAMFLSAGKYHHHLGLNTWHSLDGRKHVVGEAGLDSFTIELPKETFSSYVRSLRSREDSSSSAAPVFDKIDENELLVSDPDAIPIRITTNAR